MLPTGVTLKGSCDVPAGASLTLGEIAPTMFQTISFSVNEKLKDSRRVERTTSEKH